MKIRTRIILWAVRRKVRKQVRLIRKENGPMAKFLNSVQFINSITFLLQAANLATGSFPALVANPYFTLAQGLLAAILPSVGGIGHKLAFGEPQDPAKR